jgi:hypothetical protein
MSDFIFCLLEEHKSLPKDNLPRFRLYLTRPSGLREDIGSIGSRIDILYFKRQKKGLI